MTNAPLVALALSFLAGSLRAQTVWTGAAGTSWNNPSNWSPPAVPSAGTNVVIPATANAPSSYTANPVCADLTIASGATVTLAAGFSLSVGDDLQIDGTLVVGAASSTVTVVGDFTNNNAFTNGGGAVVLSGTGTLGGTASTTFHHLTVSGGVRTAGAAIAIAGDATVSGGATLDVGAFTHAVTGSWSSSAGTVSGSGTVSFNGSGTTTTGAGSIPAMAVTAGTRTVGTTTVAGNLSVTGGTFQIAADATVTVNGAASFTGGTFAGSGGVGIGQILDVAGDVVMGCAASPSLGANTQIRCGGNWSATAAFDPPNGIVALDGAGVASASGTLNFAQLRIQDGPKTLTAPAIVDQQVTVLGGATLNLGSLSHTVTGNWTSNAAGAAVTGTGTILFNGTGTTLTGANSIPNVSVTAGTRLFGTSTIAADLSVSGATFQLLPDATVAVGGNASFSGGTFAGAGGTGSGQILDVAGNVTMGAAASAALGANTEIQCGGNWTGTSAFDPPAGTVRLDGAGATTVGGTLNFHDLVVAAGTKTLLASASIDRDLTVLGGATFAIGASSPTVARHCTLSGAGAAVTGAGALTFAGTGTTSTGTNAISNASVTAGVRSFATSALSGNLTGTGGTIELLPDAVVSVGGNANLTGGAVQVPTAGGTAQILDVAGNVTIAVALSPIAANTQIHCGGNWSATGAFDPTAGTVRLDSAGPATASGTLNFFDLVVAGGTKTFAAAAAIDNDATLLSGGALSIGSTNLTVGRNWTSPGAATSGTGTITFSGSGTTTTGASSVPNVVVSAGVRSLATSTVAGNLTVSGGTLSLLPDAVVSVGGNATVSAGSIEAPTAGAVAQILDVAGSVTLSVAPGALAANTEIHCGGNWTASGAFDPAAGTVRLDGAGVGIASGTLHFFDLVVAGGTKTLASAAAIDNDATVLAGATLQIGSLTHTVARHWTSNASGAAVVGTGTIAFAGTGTTTTGGNPLPNVVVSAGVRSFASSAVAGDLTVNGGTFRLLPAAAVDVAGNAAFSAGILDAPTAGVSSQILDVDGDVTMAATAGAVVANTTIFCGGDWSASALFDPPAGIVGLKGPGPGTVSGSPTFASFAVSGGSKTLGAPVLFKENVFVTTGGILDVGPHTHTVRGSWFTYFPGASTVGTGTIAFEAIGTTVTGANPIPNVSVLGGARLFGPTTIAGDLTVASGTFSLLSTSTVHVLGDAHLLGGMVESPIAGAVSAVVDVDGDVTATCVAGTFAPNAQIRCGGDWAASGAFAPSDGTVALDGGGTTTVSGVGPTFELFFPALSIENGTRVAATDLLLDAASVAVASGATFDANGKTVRIAGTPVAVDGLLEVDAGASLALSATTALTVGASGTFRALGTPSSPAVVTGEAGGGYSFLVNGTIQATHYRFEQMGPAGIQIPATATIGATPFDLRAGEFGQGSSAPGSCLLDIQRAAPVELRYVDFQNAGTATFNVRSAGPAAVTLVNWGGNFGGPAFEDDPGGVVAWAAPEVTLVDSFIAIAGNTQVSLVFHTTAEFDVQAFHLLRATNPGGPFTEIPGSPLFPLGGPTLGATYQATDSGLTNGVKVYYRLEQELTIGTEALLATADATPLPPIFGNLVKVGPGAFPTIQAALTAAAPGNVVLVATGTYPSFVVTAPVRIRSDGTGPIAIDTTNGPVIVTGLGPLPAGSVTLEDMQIGSAATPSHGVVAVGNAGLVLLDGCTVDAGAGFDGLQIDATPQTVVQSCAISGGTGLRVRNGSVLYLSSGSVDELVVESASAVTHAGLTPGATFTSGGGTVNALTGVMPSVSFPKVAEPGSLLSMTVTGVPSTPVGLRLAVQPSFFDLTAPLGIDMVFLIDLLGSFPLATVLLPATGTTTFGVPIPADPAIVGFPILVQGADITLVPTLGRSTNVRALVVVP